MDEQMVLKALGRLLAGSVAEGQKADGNPSTIGWYQAGGLFGTTEGSSMLVNALVGPRGLEGALTWIGTMEEKKFVDSIVGTVTSGSNQTTACGDCKTIDTKGATLFYPLGRFCAQTPQEQFDNLGLKEQENVPIKTLFGNITDPTGQVLVNQGSTITDRFYMDVRMVGYLARTLLGDMIWQGDTANNSGPYREFFGLETIVNTGKVDVLKGIAAPLLNSQLMDNAGNAWTSDGTYGVRARFARMVMQLQARAEGAGLDWTTAEMVIVMSPNQWETVARVYACDGVDLCTPSSSQISINTSATEQRNRYEEILRRRALPILGVWYPVIIDSMLPETNNGDGTWTSDIYFLTLRINGQEVLWGEYQDFNRTFGRAAGELAAMFGAQNSDISITDGGRYAMLKSQVRGCFDLQLILKPRLVSIATFLLGRITNTVASPVGGTSLPNQDLNVGGRSQANYESLYDSPSDGVPSWFNPNG